MNMKKVVAILGTLKMLEWMAGDRGYNLAMVVFWSCEPRSTVYRYLKKLEMLGMVKTRQGKHRKQTATMYSITEAGKKYLGKAKHE